MQEQLQQFKKTFEGDFHVDNLHKLLYATDASVYRKVPLAVALPKSNNAIKQLVNFASKNQIGLIPRAAGTSLAGQCVGDGIVVDISRYFNKIINVDKRNKTVTVQPGVIRDELNAYLKPFGLFFGPNTSTSNRCMIGGMVGNNSSGTTSIKYGVTRDKVVSLKTILSDGNEVVFSELSPKEFIKKTKLNDLEGQIYSEIYTYLSKQETQEEIKKEFPKPEIKRRNTGYAIDTLIETNVFDPTSSKNINLCKLLTGSEGTLAFTTEITLKLDHLPPEHTAMVVTHYSTIEYCLKDVSQVMKHDLYTCEMLDDIILDCTKQNKKYDSYRAFIDGSPKAILMLELKSNDKNELQYQLESLKQTLLNSGFSYGSVVLEGKEIKMALELRKAGLGLLGNMIGDHKAVACVEDTAVALEDLPNYIEEFSSLMNNYEQEAVYYAHAGAGELHLRPILNLKTKEGVTHFRNITTDVAKLVKKYRGSFSGEHGDGIVRAEFLEMQVGSAIFKVLQNIKKAFDPLNTFNPGKITNAWPMDASLRTSSQTPDLKTFLDFTDSKGIVRLAEKCNGSGDCRKPASAAGTMCPSYHVTKNEKDTTRGRANMLREALTTNQLDAFKSEELKEVFDLCLSCKACATECPSNVDIATAKAEFLYQNQKINGTSRSDRFFGKSSNYNKIAATFPRLTNWLFRNSISSKFIKKNYNIALQRSLPEASSIAFSKVNQNAVNQINKRIRIILFVDEFSNYFDAQIVQDSYDLLTKLGYEVETVCHLDSARALLSKGFLEEAKAEIDKSLAFLKDKASKNSPLIGIEPSAILGFRDEYLRIARDKATAKEIAKHTYLIEEFIASEVENGNITSNMFTEKEEHIKIHNHCHQKALSNQKVTFDILNLPVNYKPTIITSGCCGMAGSFGYEKEHYKISMQIGEIKLFPAVRKSSKNTIIAANGASCRHQIKDGTGVIALHPISILTRALL